MDLGHGDRWRVEPCSACPAQLLPTGQFDVLDRPGPASRYDPTAGYRVNTTTGLPELESWFATAIRATSADSRAVVLADAATAARRRFPPSAVLTAMRRALSAELTHGILVRHRR
jgi:hypothetical protein